MSHASDGAGGVSHSTQMWALSALLSRYGDSCAGRWGSAGAGPGERPGAAARGDVAGRGPDVGAAEGRGPARGHVVVWRGLRLTEALAPHLDPTVVQRAMADAVRASSIAKRATCHKLLGHTEPRGPRRPQPGGRARRPVTLRGEDCRVCRRGVTLVRRRYAGWASGSAHTFTSYAATQPERSHL